MTDGVVKQINELALCISRKKEAGAVLANISEFDQLYRILMKRSKAYAYRVYSNVDSDLYSAIDKNSWVDVFNDTILKIFDLYKETEGDFLKFYKVIFTNKLKDKRDSETKRIIREKPHDKKDQDDKENCYDTKKQEDRNKSLISEYESIQDEKHDPVYRPEMREIIGNIFLLNAALCIKKMNKNKYTLLFFTDRLVYSVFESEEWFNRFVHEESNKLDEAVVNEFMNTLLTGKCDSVTEIKDHERRLLSEFTGNQKDNDKTCCEEKPNYHVFNSYLKNRGQEITQSAFSQQKDKYFQMLQPIKEKLGLV